MDTKAIIPRIAMTRASAGVAFAYSTTLFAAAIDRIELMAERIIEFGGGVSDDGSKRRKDI